MTTTYYFGDDYELRQYSGAAGVSKTRHIDVPGGPRIASYTDGAIFPGPAARVAPGREFELGMAGLDGARSGDGLGL